MAKSEKTNAQKPQEVLTDADNPSLIKAGDEIRLRVFDDESSPPLPEDWTVFISFYLFYECH